MNNNQEASGVFHLKREKVILHTLLDVYVYALILVPMAVAATYIKKLEFGYMAIVIGGILVIMLPYALLKGVGILMKTPKVVELRSRSLQIDDWFIPLEELEMVKLPPLEHRKAARMNLVTKEGRKKTYYLGFLKKNSNPIFPRYDLFVENLEGQLQNQVGCFQLDL